MPFTGSHAVVALPFVRTPLVPAAIAIGAMAPDLPLFLRGTPLTYGLTHTNVTVTALVALTLLVLWWFALRPAVRELAPAALAARLPPEWDATGRRVWASVNAPRAGAMSPVWRSLFPVLLAVSLVLGVITHIVWDGFTHEGRWGSAVFPALEHTWGPLPGYKWLQHGSSIAGLAILAVSALIWLTRRPQSSPVARVLPDIVRRAWWASLPLVLIGAWIVGLALYGPLTAEWTVQHLAYRVLPPACAVWGAMTLVLCAVIIVRRGRLPR
jgi:hypothetical protein